MAGRKKAELPPEQVLRLKELIRLVKPEIEQIYAAIKIIGLSVEAPNLTETWQIAALARFDDSKGFKFIKREYLENKSPYLLTEGKERRDFFQYLLKIIIKNEENIDMSFLQINELLRNTDDN